MPQYSAEQYFLLKINNAVLYILIFSFPFARWKGVMDPYGIPLDKAMVVAYFLSSIPFLIQRLSIKQMRFIIPPLLFYVLVETLSSIFNESIQLTSPFEAMADWLLILIILLLLITNHLKYRPKLQHYSLMAFVWGVFWAGVLYNLGYGVSHNYVDGVSRLRLFGNNPNSVGLFVIVAIVIILSNIFENRTLTKSKRIVLICVLIAIIPLLIASGSRGALIILFVAAALMILLLNQSYQIKAAFLSAIGVIIYWVATLSISHQTFGKRIEETVNARGDDARKMLWEAAYNIFLESPIMGVGHAGFRPAMEVYTGYAASAHNLFLELLATAGILGLLFYLIFYTNLAKFVWHDYQRNQRVLYLVLFAMLTVHLFKAGGAKENVFIWTFFSLLLGGVISTPQNRPTNKLTVPNKPHSVRVPPSGVRVG